MAAALREKPPNVGKMAALPDATLEALCLAYATHCVVCLRARQTRGDAMVSSTLHLVDAFRSLAGDPSWFVEEALSAARAPRPDEALRARLRAAGGDAFVGRARVVRALTADAAAAFADRSLDFVYVDASHDGSPASERNAVSYTHLTLPTKA